MSLSQADIQEKKKKNKNCNKILKLFSKYFKLKSSNERTFPLSHLISLHVHRSNYLEADIAATQDDILILTCWEFLYTFELLSTE